MDICIIYGIQQQNKNTKFSRIETLGYNALPEGIRLFQINELILAFYLLFQLPIATS